jgi:hypothetical protein
MPWIAIVGGVTRSWKRDRSKTKEVKRLDSSHELGGHPGVHQVRENGIPST